MRTLVDILAKPLSLCFGLTGSALIGCRSDAAAETNGDPTTETSDTQTDTSPPTYCGNDVVEDGEECDGTEVGGIECTDIDAAFVGGTVVCGASCTLDASECILAPGAALVTLNEVTSEKVLASPGSKDAIEIHNGGGGDADVSGWMLSDDPAFPPVKTYVFAEGTTIAAGEFVVLFSIDVLTGDGDLPFGISDATMESLRLADADGRVIDSVVTDGYEARVSYCRVPDATGPWFRCNQTFGAANQLSTTPCGDGVAESPEACDGDDLAGGTCESLAIGYTGGTLRCSPTCNLDTAACTTTSEIVINELISDDRGEIEIFNGSAAMIDLSSWVLTDDNVEADYHVESDMGEWAFADGTMLAPGAYLVVALGAEPDEQIFGLAKAGETVTLADPAGPTIIDHVTYGNREATVSYCRKPDGGEWMADCDATMGQPN
jgi:Lamin Tail Domain